MAQQLQSLQCQQPQHSGATGLCCVMTMTLLATIQQAGAHSLVR